MLRPYSQNKGEHFYVLGQVCLLSGKVSMGLHRAPGEVIDNLYFTEEDTVV